MANEKKFSSFAELSPQTPQGQGGGARHGSPPPGRSGEPELPPGYLAVGYFDQKDNLLKDIFVGWPEKITDALTHSRTKPKATKSSLRAFYTMLRMAQNQFEAQRRTPDKAMGDAKTQLYKLRIAAQYQRTRSVISVLCQSFLERNIDLVDRKGTDFQSFERNFNAFVEHFQAVIAYLPERAQS
jgi:CRISPR type III-A-associated protein Csm2